MNTLDVVNSGMSKSSSMTISSYADTSASTEATLQFSIEPVREHIPYIKEVEFCVVIREKVDLTAIGPNEGTIKKIGNDMGKYEYKDNVPSQIIDLPPGFTELYRK